MMLNFGFTNLNLSSEVDIQTRGANENQALLYTLIYPS